MSEPTFHQLQRDGRLWFGAQGNNRPRLKKFLGESDGTTEWTWWTHRESGSGQEAARDLAEKMSAPGLFDNPKPSRLIQRMLTLAASDPDDLVLDFFAGSGTTSQAVMTANFEDGGSRRYIMVQLPEPVEGDRFDTIADIARVRARRAGEKFAAEPAKLGRNRPDMGFRSYRLDQSTFTVWDPIDDELAGGDEATQNLRLFAENVRPEATNADIVTELLLKAGFELTTPSQQKCMGGVDVTSVADGELLILSEGTPTLATFEEMVSAQPSLIIVLDRCFGHDDELKVNALQTIRSANHSSGCDIALRVV